MTLKAGTQKTGLVLAFPFLLIIIILSAFFHSVFADSMLDIGPTINSKMKALAVKINTEHESKACEIKAIHMSESLPDGFLPSEANTVSTSDSSYPIYIFFDNENNSGIIYFYTEDETIVLNPFSAYFFSGLSALTDISGVAGWDTSKVTNMCGMFNNVKSLPDALAIKDWDTSSVTDMSYMFSNAHSLSFIDVSKWNTSNVTDMTCMFQVGESWAGNGQLMEINGLGDLDVSNVRDMTCMFYGAGQMTYYDISQWDVSKVESMNHMFCDNFKLVSLDLSGWDVSSVKTIFDMFDDNITLKTIGDVSHWNTASLIDASGWLNECSAFTGDNSGTLDLSGWDTSNLKAAGEMFLHTNLRTIDLSGWTFDSITNDRWDDAGHGIYYEYGNSSEALKGFGQMFKYSKYLTTVYISQSGLDSFNKAVESGVNTSDMWFYTETEGFTVK